MIQNGFRTDKMSLLARLVNQNVFLRVEQFKVELAGLRSKVSDREVARKRYDHYHSKILELREQRSKQKAKGKELGASDLDKLTRVSACTRHTGSLLRWRVVWLLGNLESVVGFV